MIFQITGYPRSGTAWLTTMFNLAPEVVAFHELAMTDKNWLQTLLSWEMMPFIVGDIGTYQYFPKAVIPESKKVFILRDSNESGFACQKATGIPIDSDTVGKWTLLANEWSSKWNPMIVDFYCLFKLETLEEIWNHCFDKKMDIRFPRRKVEQLLRLNIQLHEPAKSLSNPEAVSRMAELL